MSSDFQLAYQRARNRVGEFDWWVLPGGARIAAIHEESRAIDAERIGGEASEQTVLQPE
jgi:hypothetical protein